MRRTLGVKLALALAFLMALPVPGLQAREQQQTTSAVSNRADHGEHWRHALPRLRKFIVQLLEDLGSPRP
jgi:hypothetical protein